MTTLANPLAPDLLRPEEWSNVIRKLRAGTLIDAVACDYSWHARFLVRSIQEMTVDIALLSKVDLGGPVEVGTA